MTDKQITTELNSDKNERQSANWDIVNAPKNYLSLVLAQGLSAIFAFASVWLITKYLGSEGYGGIVAIIATSQVAQVLVNWTSVAIVRYGVDEFIETGKIAHTFWLRFLILLPNFALVWLTANWWFPSFANWLKLPDEVFWLVFLHFTISIFWVHFQFGLQAVKMPRLQGGLVALEKVFVFLSLFTLLVFNKLNSVTAALSYTLIPFLMTIIGFFYLQNFIFSRFSIDWLFWRKIIIFSLPLIPFTLSAYLSSGYVDAIFVSSFFSTRDLGVYSVATQINGISLQLPTLANSLLLPLFISVLKEEQTRKLRTYFKHLLPTLVLCWGLLTTTMALAGFLLIPLIFGQEFNNARQPLWILLASSTFGLPPFIGYGALSNATSTTYISMSAAIFSATVNILFNFLLIPQFGLEGCALASALMFLTTSIVFIILLRRIVEIPISWTFMAMLPGLSSILCIFLTGNPWGSFVVCLILSFIVAYLFRESVKKTINFTLNFKHR